MHEFKLMRVSADSEKLVGTFTAESAKEACIKHMEAWKARKTPYAIVLVFPNGKRNSYRDSAAYVSCES